MGARTLGAGRAGRARLSAVMVSAFFCAAQADAQPVPRGPEFQVSTYTMGNQLAPVAAANGTGFVVAWKSYQNGPAPTLFARRFDLSGITLTGEIPVNTNTSGQSDAAIASSATGFVVVWTGSDGDSYGVFGRRFDAAGNPLGPEFQANTYTTGGQALPDVAMDATGFVMVWQGGAGVGANVFARRYDVAGNTVAGPLVVSSFTNIDQGRPAVVMDGAGAFVVVWQADVDADGLGILGKRFDSNGGAVGIEFLLNSTGAGDQTYPAAAADGARFVVVWTSAGQDGSSRGVFARRFNFAGIPNTAELQVNVRTELSQWLPGAVDLINCTRCTAPQIEEFLAGEF